MRKTNVILGLVCVMGILTASCVKEKEGIHSIQKSVNNATGHNMGNLKSLPGYSGNYALSSKVGHNSSECSGCVMIGGARKHVDCQAWGNKCGSNASVAISKVEPDNQENQEYAATGLNDYEPTDEAFYYMPARSFYIENSEFENGYIWINIPEQMLERDDESNQFKYVNITFTNEAMFENL